ncbi:MAG TPA: NADH:flavin oxidoreductase/NADH oxidase [Flavobacteriaceae bacterium]|nr:NADH:flavin oxidoreductase/NADH oxidase [Flavobacteriaceae bacterium]
MSLLFEEYKLEHFNLRNRLVVAPMCQYSAEDGYATDWHLVHLGQYALGGAGAIIQEATSVSPEGRISYGDTGIWEDGQIEKYKQITKFIKEHGSVPGIQLAHAGRKASTEKPWLGRGQIRSDQPNGWKTIAPSAIPFSEGEESPVAMTLEEIKRVQEDFVQATKRSVKAGYQIIEIHAAHGYLLHQYMSPLVNKRTDEYGGSFENRVRFLLEVVEEVRKQLTNQSLWVRISACDWAEGGWDIEQSVTLSKLLKERGVEVIDVSSGGAVRHQKIVTGPNYQVPFAEQIKKEVGIHTGTVGMITDAKQAEAILQEGKADLIFVARKMLRDPYFPLNAARELGAEIQWPNQYLRGKETQ